MVNKDKNACTKPKVMGEKFSCKLKGDENLKYYVISILYS